VNGIDRLTGRGTVLGDGACLVESAPLATLLAAMHGDGERDPEVVAIRDDGGVVKIGLALADGAVVESVLIPMRTRPAGRESWTLCVSTQVGCRMGCRFCATGGMGFVRDLEPEEIAAQPAMAERLGRRPDKLVFMGMGEPLDNFDAWREAVRLLTTSRRTGAGPPIAYSTASMTMSTCGHVAGLERFARRPYRKMTIAVSLNAVDDELRSRLMPVNRRWPLNTLRDALLDFPLRNRTFLAEYVVFRGLNDRREHAAALAEWLRPFRACVNLIAYNPPREASAPAPQAEGFVAPLDDEVERFRRWLVEEGLYARRRESKGQAIGAACGQLATAYRIPARDG
jgi:23S rRNA (adenine2503-C2)-methyltransferase